jgi:hypothetical protein
MLEIAEDCPQGTLLDIERRGEWVHHNIEEEALGHVWAKFDHRFNSQKAGPNRLGGQVCRSVVIYLQRTFVLLPIFPILVILLRRVTQP